MVQEDNMFGAEYMVMHSWSRVRFDRWPNVVGVRALRRENRGLLPEWQMSHDHGRNLLADQACE
jgi:hypothetical protein